MTWLWTLHNLLTLATLGCFGAIVVDGFIRDRKEARHGR